MEQSEAHELLDDVFSEIGLLLGGVVAYHQIEDRALWQLTTGLLGMRSRIRGRLDLRENFPETPKEFVKRICPEPHPAIESFLREIQDDR
jgi:hypothetical protein